MHILDERIAFNTRKVSILKGLIVSSLRYRPKSGKNTGTRVVWISRVRVYFARSPEFKTTRSFIVKKKM